MLANEITPYVGKYFSVEYLRKNVLRQTDEEIEDINRQIATEVEDGIISDPMDGMQVNDIEGENDE